MVKTILLLLLLVFAVAGLCEFVFLIKILFYFPGKRFKTYTFMELYGGYAMRQLVYFWQKILWNGEGYSNGIIAITDNIQEKELLNCQRYIRNKNIILCKKQELLQYLDLQGDLFCDKY